MTNKKNENKVLKSMTSFGQTIASLFTFGKKKQPRNILEEEAVMSPVRVIVKNFFRNKLAIIGLTAFVLMLTFVFGGSALFPIDLYDSDPVLQNVQPGTGYLNVPSQLQKEGIKQISTGITFSVGLSEQGNVFVWGVDVRGVTNIPSSIKNERIKSVAAGDRHIVVLTEGGKILGWGNNNFGQAETPFELEGIFMLETPVQIEAGNLFSAVLTNKGNMYVWGSVLGNGLDIVPTAIQGRIVKMVPSSFNIMTILDDGTVAVTGIQGNQISNIPAYLRDGTVNVVDLAVGQENAAAIDDQGMVYAWGDRQFGLASVPAPLRSLENPNGVKAVRVVGGMRHFVVVDENGKLHAWGAEKYKQSVIPESASDMKFEYVSASFNQTFAVAEDGKVVSFGNNGFFMGTDNFGRDVLLRLIHGGRVTMTVGAVAVLISTFIGVLVGLIAGFYGGWIDNLLMRFAEIISSFPFLPLAVTLSSFLSGRLTQTQRLAMIMVILGIISWPGLARLVRGQILAEREKDFVLAARALGIRSNVVIFRHILPNVINVVIVSMTLSYAGSLLTEAGLSFLGFGVVPPSPSWGNMLTGAQQSQVIQQYWWRWVIPAVAVLLAALSINLVGDGLREAMDPKANEK